VSIAPSQQPTTLPQILDLVRAVSLRDDMLRLLQDDALLLDAGAVERMSTPCAQVLLAAGLAAESAGARFQIVNPSDAFRTALADLGLQQQFKNWIT
jgi:anti-anti-sigma regulatory factor